MGNKVNSEPENMEDDRPWFGGMGARAKTSPPPIGEKGLYMPWLVNKKPNGVTSESILGDIAKFKAENPEDSQKLFKEIKRRFEE